MAKTLIIKQADFSANALDHVSFDEVPCTAITLDEESISFSSVGQTEELVYTLTPANTTDTPVVTTSDPLVVSVSGNVLTAVGTGTANVTVTCGEITATCEVTVAVAWEFTTDGGAPNLVIVSGGTVLRDFLQTSNVGTVASGGAASGTLKAIGRKNSKDADDLYPYPIPAGASSVTVQCQNYGIIVQFLSMNTPSEDVPSPDSTYQECAKLIDGETPEGGTNWSISAWTYDERTVSIPAGADGIVIWLDPKNASTWSQGFDPESVAVTFS